MRQTLNPRIFIFLLNLSFCWYCTDSTTTAPSQQQAPPGSPMPKKEFSKEGMVLIPSGILNMGGDNKQADPDEFPKHQVVIDSFWMDITEVTNAQFQDFVDATGYITVAERPIIWEEIAKTLPPNTPRLPDSLLQPGALVFVPTRSPVSLNEVSQWWKWTLGANWQHPEGPKSSIKGRENCPVVQIAFEDAAAYAAWAGKRLPTESEWEWAARGGLKEMVYPWGNEDVNIGQPKANFWQGVFPYQNTKKDGYLGVAPVKSFEPNSYGLYDMAGNVWEWCADWYKYDYYKEAGSKNNSSKGGPMDSFDPDEPYSPKRVMRGGSFLCNDDYCSGYRVARRMKSSPDTGLNHTGFRCVQNE
jgi:formylglycine-generating enzyme required for sulfatase activity